jgi:2-keto-3-deoxy-L-fuconate dehydrogenase
MIFSLQRKVAVVTGGGSGIGKAIAERFAEQGATVCILELNQNSGEDAAKSIAAAGGKAHTFICNVADQKQVISAFKQIADRFGSVDILVNSAGIASISKLETTSDADFDRLFQVNVKGTYNSMLGAIEHMKKQKNGVILNIASVAATLGLADRFTYSMTKGAVLSMTLSVARDYIQDGIRCNSLSPARVHTPFVDGFIKSNYPGNEKEVFDKLSRTQPIGRMAKPEEIGYFALYLCSDEASFLTGCDYPIDGGFLNLDKG